MSNSNRYISVLKCKCNHKYYEHESFDSKDIGFDIDPRPEACIYCECLNFVDWRINRWCICSHAESEHHLGIVSCAPICHECRRFNINRSTHPFRLDNLRYLQVKNKP